MTQEYMVEKMDDGWAVAPMLGVVRGIPFAERFRTYRDAAAWLNEQPRCPDCRKVLRGKDREVGVCGRCENARVR
jgi:hypothetical protein